MMEKMDHVERELETVCGKPPKAKLLFVDDDEMFLRLMRVGMSKYSDEWDMDFTQDPHKAAELVVANHYEIVLSDVKMPGMDGFELFQLIRENSADTVVILITGMPEVEAAVQAIKAGALEYLRKPLSLADLETAVVNAMKERQRRREEASYRKIELSDCRVAGYRVVRKLAEGAMGTVFVAEDESDEAGKRYALKVLKASHRSADDRSDQVRRFIREAKIAMLMDHPNIIRLHDFGFVPESSLPYMIMEFFHGRPLNELPRSLHGLTYRQKAGVVRQIADALTEVHRHIICHRDIKPGNILLNEKLEVKLLDFGVAKLPESELTHVDCTMGTPAYLSPEAITNVASMGPQSDFFSLGILAYELFFGRRPFRGGNIATLSRSIVRSTPMDPQFIDPKAPVELRDFVLKLLEKKACNRYATAADVVAAIDSVLPAL